MKYKNIIFDLDGTLSNSEKSILTTLRLTFDEMGVSPPPKDILMKFIGPPLKDSYIKYCRFTDEQASDGLRIYQKYYALYGRDLNELYPDIPRLLQTLKFHGASLYVATSKEQEAAKYVLQKLSVSHFFDGIYGANHDNSLSAKADILRVLIATERLSPEDCVLIGDTIFDINGASQCNIDCIAVSYGFNTYEELRNAGAKIVAGSVKELQQLLLA